MDDNEEGDKTMESSTSDTGAMTGRAAGIVCGPLAVLCVLTGAVAVQKIVDGAISAIESKPYRNIDYAVNIKNKTMLEHVLVIGDVDLDAMGGFWVSKVLKNSDSYAVENAAKSAVIKPVVMPEVVKMPTKTAINKHFDTPPVIPIYR